MHLPQLPKISSSLSEYQKRLEREKRSPAKHMGSEPGLPHGIRGFVKSLRNDNDYGSKEAQRLGSQTIPHDASYESLGLGQRKDSMGNLRHS